MTSTTSIPLNQLASWDGNVRKTAGTDAGLAELSASILAHGLLNNLVVRKDRKGKFAVVAGGRRLQALLHLAESGKIPADQPVPCQVLAGETDAAEISLAENFVREQMHPADEFDAFRTLADKDIPAADIAARFGVAETMVLKRLKLARVSPAIIQAYRDGKTTLECLMAFAVTDDHKRQETLWKSCPAWMRTSADRIRATLTENEADAGDRRVRFVTLKAYEKAGGTARRDLFAADDDGIFIDDIELLDKLVAAKLENTAASLRAEGWKWVEVLHQQGYEIRSKFRRIESAEGPLPEKLQAEYDKLAAERKKLDAKKNLTEQDEDRLSEIDDRVWQLDRERPEVFTSEQRALAGAFIEIERDGKLDIQRGYVTPEDAKSIKPGSTDSPAKPKSAERAGLSQSLLADLTGHRTAAMAALLAGSPRVALVAIVHSLGMKAFYSNSFGGAVDFDVAATSYPPGFRDRCKSRGIDEIEKLRKQWKETLPAKQSEFWQWCIDASDKTLLSLLAFFAALTCRNTDQLGAPLGLDMNKWFTPTADNFFGRIGKDEILKAVKEATGKPVAPATGKLKKSELAVFAERAVKDSGWLPKPLRVPAGKAATKPQKKAA